MLALRMAKPVVGLLAEEDSAELGIVTAISASLLALNAYDHAAELCIFGFGFCVSNPVSFCSNFMRRSVSPCAAGRCARVQRVGRRGGRARRARRGHLERLCLM